MKVTEFDQYADEYYKMLKAGIRMSGEQPEFFAEYKVCDTLNVSTKYSISPELIFDFGSGIGNSIPGFRKFFPGSTLVCSDVSLRSLEISQKRFPGDEIYVHTTNGFIDRENQSVDVIFATCVFHHIPEVEHEHWFKELVRILKPNGLMIVFEHNPRNPLTVSTVKHCPFDVNAKLIRSRRLEELFMVAGLKTPTTVYRIFFPSWLSFFRPLESWRAKVPFGAQYYTWAKK